MTYTNINNGAEFRRNQLKSVMDSFCTFSWGEVEDMFIEFGAFIVGGKDALKFYNGPGFSNEYAQPQFNKAAGQLQGVNFTTQQISFTMGVYWVTEAEYRKLIYLLNPLRVDFLAFGFETKYGYQAKLSKLGDSTRHIVGRSEKGELVYYTEIPLTFEVQGAQCATAQNEFEWDGEQEKVQDENGDFKYCIYTFNRKRDENGTFLDDAPENSDLSFPIELTAPINIVKGGDLNIKLEVQYSEEDPILLFNLKLQDTTEGSTLNLKYKSDLGILFLSYGNGIDKILSLTNYTDIGSRLVNSIDCHKFEIPGVLNDSEFNVMNLNFILTVDGIIDLSLFKITAKARTNVI